MSQTRNMPIQVITRSAILLALVLASQALHLPQLVTGPLVNAVLVFSCLAVSFSSGVSLSILVVLGSFFLGFMKVPLPQLIPLIMVANLVLVIIFYFIKGNNIFRNTVALIFGALCKFVVFYIGLHYIFAWLGLKVPEALYVTFGFMQIVTAIIGGIIAILIYKVISKK